MNFQPQSRYPAKSGVLSSKFGPCARAAPLIRSLHPKTDSWPSLRHEVVKTLFPSLKNCEESYDMMQKSAAGTLESWQDKCHKWRISQTKGEEQLPGSGNSVVAARANGRAKRRI